MLRFKAKTLDGDEVEFNFTDIDKVYKDDGVFFLSNQSVIAPPCLIESVKFIGED